MRALSELPPSIRGFLRGALARYRRLSLMRSLGWAIFGFLLWLLLLCGLDRVLHLPATVRGLLLAIGAISALGIMAWPLGQMRRPVDWVQVAQFVEDHTSGFGQRLVTVTSQLLDAPEHRGSAQILDQLVADIERHSAGRRHQYLLSARPSLRPWGMCAAIGVVIIVLIEIPSLGMPQLLLRAIDPAAPIPAVTTTRIHVTPGDCDVAVAESLRVEVQTEHLSSQAVWIHVNDDGAHWSNFTMESAGDGNHFLTLASVERDLRYIVTAGDAKSPEYLVRVKRPPAVSEFRIRYTFPAYTGQPPFSAANSTGAIEAPVGTEILLTVIATEPLASAAMRMGAETLPMEPAGQENARQVTFTIRRDAAYDISLTSDRGIAGSGPAKLRIHATADHAPIVHLQQAGQFICVNPGDRVPLYYQAIDDFGLEAVSFRAAVNDGPPVQMPWHIEGDRRNQNDAVNFDVGSLKVALGDTIAVTIAVTDGAGQTTLSDPLRMLVAPNAVSLESQSRANELASAAQLAQMVANEVEAAAGAMDEVEIDAEPGAAPRIYSAGRTARHLTSASEAASLLSQSLMRVVVHSRSTALNVALAEWIDLAQALSFRSDELFRSTSQSPAERAPITAALADARRLAWQIRTAASGERAAAALGDIANLRMLQQSLGTGAASGLRERMLGHLRDDIHASEAELHLASGGGDLESRFAALVEQENTYLNTARPIDFAAAARQWATAVSSDAQQRSGFDVRLLAAAHAQAVRFDADARWSADLLLGSRAVANIESQLTSEEAAAKAAIKSLPDVLGILQAQHDKANNVQPATTRPMTQSSLAEQARTQLSQWAGDLRTGKPASRAASSIQARNAEAELTALLAGSQAADRNYRRASELDEFLAGTLVENARQTIGLRPGGLVPATIPAASLSQRVEDRVEKIDRAHQSIGRAMSTANAADDLSRSQQQLSQEIAATDPANVARLAGEQRSVADAIAKIERDQQGNIAATQNSDDSNWRSRATAALLKSQEDLSAMPQALAAVESAVPARHDADMRAQAAKVDADNAPAERKDAADRAARQAAQDAAEAADRLTQLLNPILPRAAADLADRLEPFAPEATAAHDWIKQGLTDALESLRQAANSGDVSGTARAAADARQAIDAAQAQLARAQDALIARDPLIAARWFASAAADSMLRSPGDLSTARLHQASATLALSRAWDRAIQRAASQRLALLPTFQAAYATPAASGDHPPTLAAPLDPNFSASRQWGQLRAGGDDQINTSLAAPDPAGFEEDLRLYFAALEKAQEKPK